MRRHSQYRGQLKVQVEQNLILLRLVTFDQLSYKKRKISSPKFRVRQAVDNKMMTLLGVRQYDFPVESESWTLRLIDLALALALAVKNMVPFDLD